MHRRALFSLLPVSFLSNITLPSLFQKVTFWHSKADPDKSGAKRVLHAFENRLSNVIVEDVSGTVERVLADDVEGSRHQRFIVDIGDQQTVLVVHNIDLAPRIDALREGDRVLVKGEYEWNDLGGLIHWTHKDPSSTHEDGWIEHKGQRYE